MVAHVGGNDLSLESEMLQFTGMVDELGTADVVLDRLHKVSFGACKLSVIGALLFPVRWGDLSGFAKGKTVFLHSSVPEGWWEEWLELTRQHPGPGLALAQGTLAPITMTDLRRWRLRRSRCTPFAVDSGWWRSSFHYGFIGRPPSLYGATGATRQPFGTPRLCRSCVEP